MPTHFPLRRIVPELGNPNIRELFVREYRLIYSIKESRVVILGLIHGKGDSPKSPSGTSQTLETLGEITKKEKM